MQPLFFFGGWVPLVRIVVIGTLTYAALVVLLRVSGKRTLSQMNAFDFVVTVALGAVFGRALTARNVSLSEAVTALVLLVGLQYAVASLKIRSGWFAGLITTPPSLLFYRGRFLRAAMRRERVTDVELLSVVRQHGACSFDEIEAVVLEPDGRFGVIRAGGLPN